MGFGRNDNTADVKKAAEADMTAYGTGVADEASRSYRKVLETVSKELQDTAAREATLKNDIKSATKPAGRPGRRAEED